MTGCHMSYKKCLFYQIIMELYFVGGWVFTDICLQTRDWLAFREISCIHLSQLDFDVDYNQCKGYFDKFVQIVNFRIISNHLKQWQGMKKTLFLGSLLATANYLKQNFAEVSNKQSCISQTLFVKGNLLSRKYMEFLHGDQG